MRRSDPRSSARAKSTRARVPARSRPFPFGGIDHRGPWATTSISKSLRPSFSRRRRRPCRVSRCPDRRSTGRSEHHVRQEFRRLRSRREVDSRGTGSARPGRDSHGRRLSGVRLAERLASAAAHAARIRMHRLKSPNSRSKRSRPFWWTRDSIRRSFVPRQLELLRLPQNLSLFLDAGFDASRAPMFGTAKVLFDRYWDAKRQSVADQVATSPERWLDVIETLCDEMTSAQQLSVAREKLDPFSPGYLKQMASEGVLTFDGRRYGFGHESFFDYCFARLFASSIGTTDFIPQGVGAASVPARSGPTGTDLSPRRQIVIDTSGNLPAWSRTRRDPPTYQGACVRASRRSCGPHRGRMGDLGRVDRARAQRYRGRNTEPGQAVGACLAEALRIGAVVRISSTGSACCRELVGLRTTTGSLFWG